MPNILTLLLSFDQIVFLALFLIFYPALSFFCDSYKCCSSILCFCEVFSVSAPMPSLALLFLVLLSFLLLPFISVAASFDECISQRCGNIVMDYPLGIADQGCGDPDFQLHDCNSPARYIMMNGTKFYVFDAYADSGACSVAIEIKIPLESGCFNFWKLRSGALEHGSKIDFSFTDNYYLRQVKVIYCQTNLSKLSDVWWPLCSSWYISFLLSSRVFEQHCHKQSPIYMTTNWTESDFKSKGRKLLEDRGTWIEGNVFKERASKCNNCSGECGYHQNLSFQCFEQPSSKKSNRAKKIGLAAGAAGTAGLLVFLILATILWKRIICNHPEDLSTEALVTDKKLLCHLQIFSYGELKDATSSFAEENIIGRGGFGCVYKGKLRDGRLVAVKRLHRQRSAIVSEFLNEARAYSNLQHPNIVALYGCCVPQGKKWHGYFLLVFEFVCNGTLAEHIQGNSKTSDGLSWNTRLKIAVQTAEALAFLHTKEQPVLHRDVKSSNILLDEHLDAKVADLGICKAVPWDMTHVTTAPVGTPGYMDPQYYESFYLTDKSDVYSFGVVLLEIVSGLKAVDFTRMTEEMNLANMMRARMHDFSLLNEVIDAKIGRLMESDETIGKMVREVTRLACSCVEIDRNKRPCMEKVADCLKSIAVNVGSGTQLEEVTPPVTI